ncbi:MAG: HD domain-containing protein [Actinomycetota bacterium]
MSTGEFEDLILFVTLRYIQSGKPSDVVGALNEHNFRVLAHVDDIAKGEELNEADYELLKTIAILHDVAKADSHLMLHAEVGAQIAADKLREMGKGEDFIRAVVRGIQCHMGPPPFIEEETRKYNEATGEEVVHPQPESRIEQVFYDADMLALIDVEGVRKVVVLRTNTPQFIEEDIATAAADGGSPRAAAYRSAFQSVQRAADSLYSETAREIAERLIAEARLYVEESLAMEAARPG